MEDIIKKLTTYINEKIPYPFIATILILVIFPYIISNWETLKTISADIGIFHMDEKADLVLSPLSDQRITCIEGHNTFTAIDGRKVYIGGAKLALTLSHNKKSDHTINIHTIKLQIKNFYSGKHPIYTYKLNPKTMNPQGTVKPYEFRVSLYGNDISKAKWTIEKTNYQSKSENLLDITSPIILQLTNSKVKANNDVIELRGTILAQKTGFYKIALQFFYSVNGKDKNISTETISIYYEEDKE